MESFGIESALKRAKKSFSLCFIIQRIARNTLKIKIIGVQYFIFVFSVQNYLKKMFPNFFSYAYYFF